ASCQNKTCMLGTCSPGFANCNFLETDGCETNLANDATHCGACGNDCTAIFPHAQTTCAGGGNCQFNGCQPNFWDLDGNPSNASEYGWTMQSATDAPDDSFTDQNCDGIDGDVNQAIFVATSGNDINPGTKAAPMRTINAALAKAAVNAKPAIYVSEGI